MSVLALSGGVGGAKLAAGLARALRDEALTVCCNTGDDMRHLGLRICPDIDSVTYALAGLDDRERGWGRSGETWNFMDTLAAFGGDSWFWLGDADLALHVHRSQRLEAGDRLSEVTASIAQSLGIRVTVAPMSDDAVATRVHTAEGELAFQHYFVREACGPAVTGFDYPGADAARVSPPVARALADPALRAIVFCPSNPYVSLGPILAVPGIAQALRGRLVPSVAVSPIIAGQALKGPAAKMMRELGIEVSAFGVATLLRRFIDGLVIDTADAVLAPRIRELGLQVLCSQTVMYDDTDRQRLAEQVLHFAGGLAVTA